MYSRALKQVLAPCCSHGVVIETRTAHGYDLDRLQHTGGGHDGIGARNRRNDVLHDALSELKARDDKCGGIDTRCSHLIHLQQSSNTPGTSRRGFHTAGHAPRPCRIPTSCAPHSRLQSPLPDALRPRGSDEHTRCNGGRSCEGGSQHHKVSPGY